MVQAPSRRVMHVLPVVQAGRNKLIAVAIIKVPQYWDCGGDKYCEHSTTQSKLPRPSPQTIDNPGENVNNAQLETNSTIKQPCFDFLSFIMLRYTL